MWIQWSLYFLITFILPRLSDSGDGNSDYDYFEINPPELNDSIPESASVSSGATNVKQKGNSTATPNKQGNCFMI